MALDMDFTQFIEAFGIALGFGVAAVNYRQLLVGEIFGVASLIATAIAIDGYFLSWPLTPAGVLWVDMTITWIVFFPALVLDDVSVRERAKSKPQFKIEITGIIYVFQSRERPIQRDVWLPVRISNEGAPSSIRECSLDISFRPKAGFKLSNGHLLKPHFSALGSLGPDGKTSVWGDPSVIPHLGQLVGWIGIGIWNAPTIDAGGMCEECKFAGIDKITVGCCDHSRRWFYLTITSDNVSWAENNCFIDEVYRLARRV
jgi:hypothetical protein